MERDTCAMLNKKISSIPGPHQFEVGFSGQKGPGQSKNGFEVAKKNNGVLVKMRTGGLKKSWGRTQRECLKVQERKSMDKMEDSVCAFR